MPRTLAEIACEDHGIAPAALGDHFALVNGGMVTAERFAAIIPQPDATIAFHPIPEDPGTIVLAVLAVISTVASFALAPGVPALSKPKENPDEKRYGFQRFSAIASVGDPIPVVFGTHVRYGGKVVSMIPEEDAAGSGNARAKILILLGEGEWAQIGDQTADFDELDPQAGEIDGVFLNDQPASDFADVRVSGRMGDASQGPMRGFEDTELLREVGIGGSELPNTSGAPRTGSDDAEAIIMQLDACNAARLRVRFSRGLYRIRKNAQVDTQRVVFRARHRTTAGPGTWSAWTEYPVEQANQSEFFASPVYEFAALDAYDVQVQRVTEEPDDATVTDAMLWDSVVEITDATNTYDGLAMLAIVVTAGEKLQAVPSVSIGCRAIKVRTYQSGPADAIVWGEDASSRAMEQVLAVLTNTVWGIGGRYSDTNVNFQSWLECRQYAAEMVTHASGRITERFECNIVIATREHLFDWVRKICETAHVTPVTVGDQWRFIQARPHSAPVETYGEGDIAQDDEGTALFSYRREVATGGLTRPNQIVVRFQNQALDGETSSITYPDDNEGQLWFGGGTPEVPRPFTVDLEGITDADIAKNEAVYQMRVMRFVTRSYELTITHPLVTVQPGDRFDLACQVMAYGLGSGVVGRGSTVSSIRVDQNFAMEPGTHIIEVVQPDGTREQRELTTTGTVLAGGVLTLATPLDEAPAAGSSRWSVFRQDRPRQPVICTGVILEDDEDFRWTVQGVGYVADIFNPDPLADIDPQSFSDFSNTNKAPGPVFDLRAFDRPFDGVAASERRIVELSWRQKPEDQSITQWFQVYRRTSGSTAWVLVPEASLTTRSALIEITDIDRGYAFKVIAISPTGSRLSPYDERVPQVALAFNSQELPPLPPVLNEGQTVVGNTWDIYIVPFLIPSLPTEFILYAGRIPDAQVNHGFFDCHEIARIPYVSDVHAHKFEGLQLPPGVPVCFFVRAQNEAGRMSFSATPTNSDNGTPPGGGASSLTLTADPHEAHSIEDTQTFDLATDGTLTNLAFAAGPTFNGATQPDRLQLVSAGSAGQWLLPEVTLTGDVERELTFWLGTANDADDPAVNTDPFRVPSFEADQWGIVLASKLVGLICPPYPPDELSYTVEVRTQVASVWGDWRPFPFFTAILETFGAYQLRVTIDRETSPYRPAITDLIAVVTS